VLQEFAVKVSQWDIKHVFSLRHVIIAPEVSGIIHLRFKLVGKWPWC